MNLNVTFRRSINHFATLIFLTASAFSASAWNNVGHRTVAELAWRQMDKTERGAVTDLLKQHPHYKQLLAANVPAGVDTNEWVFLTAAVWPDMVRPAKSGQAHKPDSITKYDLYPHAIGYPFLRPGETNRALIEHFYIAKPDAEMVLSNAIATVRNASASAPDRAVSLCWALHLFGDLHQPLHTANEVSAAKPKGDRLGGHHFALDSRGKQIDMHSFWDQLAGVDSSYKYISGLAAKLAGDRELQPSALKEYRDDKTIASWVQEGYRIAVQFAYSEKHIHLVHASDVESGKIPESAIPRMSADYASTARKIALRRVVLAGQRLTDELKRDF